MSLLAHSTFQDVFFPAVDRQQEADETLALRRVLRFPVAPNHMIKDMSFVLFDFETTGLDAQTDRIIEMGAIRYQTGRVLSEFSTLVDPQMAITEQITNITGITPAMLEGQPTIQQVLTDFLDFIDGGVLVAHNADFDMGFLRQACLAQGVELEWPVFCTLKLARTLLPQLERKDLDTLAQHYELQFEARHRSIGDAKVTGSVLNRLLAHEGRHLRTWADLLPFRSGS